MRGELSDYITQLILKDVGFLDKLSGVTETSSTPDITPDFMRKMQDFFKSSPVETAQVVTEPAPVDLGIQEIQTLAPETVATDEELPAGDSNVVTIKPGSKTAEKTGSKTTNKGGIKRLSAGAMNVLSAMDD